MRLSALGQLVQLLVAVSQAAALVIQETFACDSLRSAMGVGGKWPLTFLDAGHHAVHSNRSGWPSNFLVQLDKTVHKLRSGFGHRCWQGLPVSRAPTFRWPNVASTASMQHPLSISTYLKHPSSGGINGPWIPLSRAVSIPRYAVGHEGWSQTHPGTAESGFLYI